MLSCSKIRITAKSAHSYYSADDYYSQNNQGSDPLIENQVSENLITTSDQNNSKLRVPSFWHGKLAETFNLSGEVNGKILDDLTLGILPNGIRMQGKINDKQEEIHDAGRDLTFSAPKSLSVLSEVLEVQTLNKLHNFAVKSTLDYIEENYSYTRTRIDGKIKKELTGNFLFGAYTHNTSRELDPQLHTHCVTLNVTKRNDGEYRAAFFDPIFDDYKYLGLIYRSNLAFELQKAGFNIEVTDSQQGFFEIQGFPKEVIDAFSQRRKQIEEKSLELGMDSAKAKEIVVLLTRDKKIDIANHILKEDWNDTLKDVLKNLKVSLEGKDIEENGQNLDKIFRTSLKKSWKQNLKENFENIIEEKLLPLLKIKTNDSSKPANYAKEAVNSAVASLSERNSVFTEKDLITKSLKNGLGQTTHESIVKEIEKLKEKGFLLTGEAIGYKSHLTTKALLDTELAIIEYVKESLKAENHVTPFYSKSEFQEIVKDNKEFSKLENGQKRAIEHILTSPETISSIQGYAGTGKTHMLRIADPLLKNKNIEILGFAPTGTAVKEMENVGIKSKTLQWFLGQYSRFAKGKVTIEDRKQIQKEFRNKLIFLDEGSLVSSEQMKDFLTIRKSLNLKVISMGDSKQLNAVGAGNPFYQMQKSGQKTVIMNEIIRQKNEKLKSAVYDTIKASEPENINKGYIKKAFQNIDNIIEIKPDKEPKTDLEKIKQKIEQIDKMALKTAEQYTSLTKSERNNCLILIPSNESRAKINSYIRINLKNTGELGNKFELRTILINQSLDEAQKANINTYQKGDILRFNKSYKTNNIVQDIYYQVLGKDFKKNNIHLIDPDSKKEIIWNPSKLGGARKGILEVYRQENREFSIGEKINFTRGFLSRGITNSLSAEIADITDRTVKIQLENKEILEINKSDALLKHIDYGYGYTAHRAQGKTVDNVIAVLESYRPGLTNQKSFYVEISRARYGATLIVDDKEKIIKRLEKETGEKISAIDFIKGKNFESRKKFAENNKLAEKDGAKQKEPKKYLIPQFTDHEISEKFKEEIASNFQNSALTNLEAAINQAFNKIGIKIRFGAKKENEVCWYGNAGYVKSYQTGEILKWGTGNIKNEDKTKFKEITKEELEKEKLKFEEKKKQIEQQKLKQKNEATKKANLYFNSYPDTNKKLAPSNQYLIRKNIPEALNIKGIKFTKDNNIVIPLHDIKGKIHSLQFITQNGDKKFIKGGEKQGHFFLITKNPLKQENDILLAEGFATAVTIHQVTGKPVAVCFDAGNIEHVLKNLKEAHPQKQYIIAADNDMWKEHNTGKEKAELAAKKYGAKVILPQFSYNHKDHQPTDFNDLHKLAGIDEVKKQLSNNIEIQHHSISTDHQFHKGIDFNY